MYLRLQHDCLWHCFLVRVGGKGREREVEQGEREGGGGERYCILNVMVGTTRFPTAFVCSAAYRLAIVKQSAQVQVSPQPIIMFCALILLFIFGVLITMGQSIIITLAH